MKPLIGGNNVLFDTTLSNFPVWLLAGLRLQSLGILFAGSKQGAYRREANPDRSRRCEIHCYNSRAWTLRLGRRGREDGVGQRV